MPFKNDLNITRLECKYTDPNDVANRNYTFEYHQIGM